MKMKRNDGIKTVSEIITESFGVYLKNNYKVLVLLFVTLAVTVSLCFVKISTTNTIASFNINDYEVGQIADVTIKAIKTLPADYDNPIPIEKGEKVIRKGFPITEA